MKHVGAASQFTEDPAPQPTGDPESQFTEDPVPQPTGGAASQFTGGLIGLIGINLLQFLLTCITLGLAAPWAVCMKERWMATHTTIDGKPLTFDGTGGQLFGNYIKWFLLTVITLGIYGFWLNINMKKWVVKHTHTVAGPEEEMPACP